MKLSRNIQGLIIFLLISIVSISLILYFSVNEKTYEVLFGINPLFLVYCIVLWFLALTIDALGVKFFVLGTDEKIRLQNSYKLSAIRIFFNLITPFTFGGQPFNIYVLKKYGVPGGKGSVVVITRLLCVFLFTASGSVIFALIFRGVVQNNIELRYAFIVSLIVLVLQFAFLLIVMLFPPLMKSFFRLIGFIGHKISFIKDRDSFTSKISKEIDTMRNSFLNYFKKHPGYLFLGFLCSLLYFFINIIIVIVIINGFGIGLSLKEGIGPCFMLFFLISFMPTPGSSGLGEGIFILLFRGLVPYYLIGLVIILWRFFFQYISALIGALFSARFFSKNIINNNEKKIPVEP